MMKKLDKNNINILWELFQNSRIPLSTISEKLHISKSTIKYRMEGLMKNGILNKNYAVIDMSKFGILSYEIFVKLQGIPFEQETKGLEKLKNEPNVGWLITLNGNFSFLCSTFVTNPSQFYKIYKKIKILFYPYITNFVINIAIKETKFRYPFFKNFKKLPKKISILDKKDSRLILNKVQWELLKILADNSRTHIIKIADKLNITEKTVRSYIKILEEKKIITNYTCQLHPGRRGYLFYLLAIRLNKVNEDLEYFIKEIPEIFYFTECAGFYDLRIEFYVEQESRIYEIEQEIYRKFGNSIFNIHVMQIKKEYTISYFNFPYPDNKL